MSTDFSWLFLCFKLRIESYMKGENFMTNEIKEKTFYGFNYDKMFKAISP